VRAVAVMLDDSRSLATVECRMHKVVGETPANTFDAALSSVVLLRQLVVHGGDTSGWRPGWSFVDLRAWLLPR